MNRETRVECAVCGRMVELIEGATNIAGEPIMYRHWRADVLAWQWCPASARSPQRAAEMAGKAVRDGR